MLKILSANLSELFPSYAKKKKKSELTSSKNIKINEKGLRKQLMR